MKTAHFVKALITLMATVTILSSFKIGGPVHSGNRTSPDKNNCRTEGCSSCPPADELIAGIQKETAGESVYVLAYHVDYWDHLGWKDIFSSAEYSNRQLKY